MKTDAPAPARPEPKAAARDPFAATLKRTTPARPALRNLPVGRPPPVKEAQTTAREVIAAGDKAARTLQQVRTGHEAHAQQLTERRAELDTRVHGRLESRALDQMTAELSRPMEPERPQAVTPVSQAVAATGQAPAPTGQVMGTPRSDAAMELVTKIEVWMKSNRPALTLGVGGALQAEVTVERTGPGRVSLSLRGRNGPPSHSDVRAVRDALERRGLLLTSVRIC